jgi:predicted RNA polymerase sigma factor
MIIPRAWQAAAAISFRFGEPLASEGRLVFVLACVTCAFQPGWRKNLCDGSKANPMIGNTVRIAAMAVAVMALTASDVDAEKRFPSARISW